MEKKNQREIRCDKRRKNRNKGRVMMKLSIIEESYDERRWNKGTTKKKEKKNQRIRCDKRRKNRTKEGR